MKVVVIGGTGLVGSRVVSRLRALGHEPIAASPRTGIDAVTGEGVAAALRGAAAVTDVSNSPVFTEPDVIEFFTTSTRNLLRHAAEAGVDHFVALSVVGAEAMPDSPYLRAKRAQESLIVQSGMPYSIVKTTQFFEFVQRIADAATVDSEVRLPPVRVRPIGADDVAATLGEVAVGTAVNGVVELAGPEEFRLDDLVGRVLRAQRDTRSIVTAPAARYFGGVPSERSLLPAGTARLGALRFEDWLRRLDAQP